MHENILLLSAQAKNTHRGTRAQIHTHSLWKSMTLAISYSARRLRQQKAPDALLVSTSWAERHTESAWRGPGWSNVPAIQYNTIQQACTVRLTKKLRVYCYKSALVASPFALNKLHYLGCQSGRKIIHPGLSSQTHSIHFGVLFFFSRSLQCVFTLIFRALWSENSDSTTFHLI